MIWYFIKFCTEESHADQFMAGGLYLNTLGYFKERESQSCDGRMDSTEAVAVWWQADDLVMKLSVPGKGDTEITKKDLAGPISMSFGHHNNLHLLCLYALDSTGFERLNEKTDYAPEDADKRRRQLRIDARCFKLGKFAVVFHAVPFLDQLREALKGQGYMARGKLVEYYDDEVFHGEIPMADIPFRKQKRFSYQREFRLCVEPRTQQNSAITINIGDISHISAKVDSCRLSGHFELRPEPTRPASELPKHRPQ
jgi:hypothetical protein